MFSQLQSFRRQLHQIPELELHLPQTKDFLLRHLRTLPCQLSSPIESSVIAYFDNQASATIAFRSDMDALPIEEQNDVPYRSQHPGRMHACGHDAHMAMLLGFAHCLPQYLHTLKHNILCIFQPGEESPGGARLLCESGLLERYHVKRIYGMHLWPGLPAGVIASRSKVLMARSSEVNIDIYGKSVHTAKYEQGQDALECACRYLCDLYAMERKIDCHRQRLLRFNVLHAGSARNIVSDHARLEGTLRACDESTYQYLRRQLSTIAAALAPARFSFTYSEGYPILYNDPDLITELCALFPEMTLLEKPQLTSEDFSWYLQKIPGVFLLLGSGSDIPLHSDRFDFDERILMSGLNAWIRISKTL